MAVAGAYRIPYWDEKFHSSLPEREEGRIFFMSFLVSTETSPVAPLRLVRFCLKENPDVSEIIYEKKRWNRNAAGGLQLIRRPVRNSFSPVSLSTGEQAGLPDGSRAGGNQSSKEVLQLEKAMEENDSVLLHS